MIGKILKSRDNARYDILVIDSIDSLDTIYFIGANYNQVFRVTKTFYTNVYD